MVNSVRRRKMVIVKMQANYLCKLYFTDLYRLTSCHNLLNRFLFKNYQEIQTLLLTIPK